VAEGVETLAQRDWLLHNGCDVMQGFLVSPAVTAEQARTFPASVSWGAL